MTQRLKCDYSVKPENLTSYALGELAVSRRTLLHMQQRTASGRHGLRVESMLSIDAYLIN